MLNGLHMEFVMACINFELMRSCPLLFFAFMDVMIFNNSTSSVGDIYIDRVFIILQVSVEWFSSKGDIKYVFIANFRK